MTGLDRALGVVEGKLDRLLQDQRDAVDSRRAVHTKLDELDNKLTLIEVEAKATSERLAKVEAPVAELSRWKERAIGAVMIVSFVSAAAGALIVAFFRRIWSAL